MGIAQKPASVRRAVEAPTRTVAGEEYHFLDSPVENGTLVTDANGRVRSASQGVVSVSIDHEVGATERIVLMTTGASDRTVTLPAATDNRELVVKKIDTGVGKVRVLGNIDAEDNYELTVPFNFVRVVADGGQWYVIGNN